MRHLAGGIACAVAVILLILIAVSNRMPVELRVEPLPFYLALPLYAALLGTLVLGFVLGGVVAFFAGGRTRRRARRAAAEVERLKVELARARDEARTAGAGRPAPAVAAGPPPSLPQPLPKAS